MIDLETAMAKAQMDNVKRRDPKNINNKMSLAQLRELTPSIQWDVYLKAVNAPASEHYIVTSPDFFRAEEKLLAEHPLEQWKTYMRWQAIHRSAPYLTKAMDEENFDFFAHTLAGQEEQLPRWRRCTHRRGPRSGRSPGPGLCGSRFPARKQGAHSRNGACHRDTRCTKTFESVSWMTPATKAQAIVKLKGIEDKIGYPSHWRDYSSVKITRDSYLGATLNKPRRLSSSARWRRSESPSIAASGR